MQSIAPTDLKAWLDDPARPKPLVLDVREDWEVKLCRLSASIHIPMSAIPARSRELNREAETVVYCHHGGRSAQVGLYLERLGFGKVYNLAGGINAWSRQVDASVATY
jgi:rhodanese-related sulfurtransferase